MTDKKIETAHTAAPQPGATTPAKPANSEPNARTNKKPRSALVPALAVAVVLVAGLGGAVWYQQQAFQQSGADLLTRVQRNAATTDQALQQGKQALGLAQQQADHISRLEQELRTAKNQIGGLEQAFQLLTDSGSDLVLINDIDHLVTIAQQQLQLGGNVANAVISLETAQAQLARANRPGLASLLQTINGDLDRLRAASTIDIALLSTRLDELASLVSHAPLLVPDDAHPETVASAAMTPEPSSSAPVATTVDPNAPWWQRSLDQAGTWTHEAWDTLGKEFGQLVSIRRVDDATALLLSPEQATQLRENLRLRIMTAQLALMMRQPGVWTTETASLVKALETRFDQQSPQSRKAVTMARQMADTNIDVKLPTVNNSLQALEALREASAKEAQSTDTPAPAANDATSSAPDAQVPGTPEAAPATEDKPQSDTTPDADTNSSQPQTTPQNQSSPDSLAEPGPAGTDAHTQAMSGVDLSSGLAPAAGIQG
ncbi:MAG: uroporphyrinogen-III C-methyltransferase [Burkholderiaceae bacterium]|nr:uroporphyrinogen-III C-methyltransferase [Burkholderiaceae bacterium]